MRQERLSMPAERECIGAMETNMKGYLYTSDSWKTAQLYYTQGVIKDLHRSLWKKISE